VGEAKRITEDDVAACVAHTRARSIFDLANAVGQGDRQTALRIARQMLADRESPLRLCAMLARHIRQLATARELDEKRMGEVEIASELGIPPFFVQETLRQARRWTPRALRAAFELLYEADKSLKSSRLPDELVVEQLVARLAA
jgi:DNA polymerase-3 subunit delta